MKVEGNKVIIEFNPNETRPSKSGKSDILFTSGGFTWVKTEFGDIGISVNIIKRK